MRAPYKKLLVSATPFLIIIVGILWFVGYEASKAESLVFADRTVIDGIQVTGEGGGSRAVSVSINNHTLNATRQLSDLVLSSLTETAQGGDASLDNLTINIEDLLADVEPVKKAKHYKLSELATIPNPDKNTLRRYADNFFQAVVGNFYEGLGDEAGIIYDTFGDTSEAEKRVAEEKLGKAAATYKKIARDLIETPVPLQLASRHLEMANAYLQLANATELFQFAVRDPLLAIKALQPYYTAVDLIVALGSRKR